MKRIGIDFGSSYIKCSDAKSEKLFALDKKAGGESVYKIPNIITYFNGGKTKLGSFSYKARRSEDIKNAVSVSNIKACLSNLKWSRNISENVTVNAVDVMNDIMKSLYELLHSKNKNEDDYRATVTVPVCFSERQRQIISKAAEKAGFKVESVITEPFASLFYLMRDHFDCADEDEHNVLIIDIGGGTLDICLVNISSDYEKCTVKTESTAGINFGGITINNKIINDFLMVKYCNELAPLMNDTDTSFAEQRKSELFDAVDETKAEIFSEDFDEDSLEDTIDMLLSTREGTIDMEISAADVYNILDNCTVIDDEKLKQQICKLLDDVIDDSDIYCEDITDIFITGGSSMIPYFKNVITEYLEDNDVEDIDSLFELYNDLAIDEQAVGSVALGAGIYNTICADEDNNIVIMDKIPFEIFTRDLYEKKVTPLMADCMYKEYYSPVYPLKSVSPETIEVYQKMPDGSDDEVSLGYVYINCDILQNCSFYRIGIDLIGYERKVFVEFGTIEGNKNNAEFIASGGKKYLETDI